MWLSLSFHMEIQVGGSLGKSQQTEAHAEIVIFTRSVPSFSRFMTR